MKWTWKIGGLVGLLGLAAGVLSSLLGIGAGIIVVPALSLAWDKIYDSPQHLAQGTALALMVPMAVAGALRYHFSADPSNWKVALPIAVYALLGALVIFAVPLLFARHIGYTNVLGNVNWHTVGIMSLTAIVGVVWLGAPLANSLATETLRKLFGVLAIIVGIRMLGWHAVIISLFSGGSNG